MNFINQFTSLIKNALGKGIELLRPLEDDKDIKSRIIRVLISTIVYYIAYVCAITLLAVFLSDTINAYEIIFAIVFVVLGFLPWLLILIILFRFYQNFVKRSFIPGGIGLFFAAFVVTSLVPIFLEFLSDTTFLFRQLQIEYLLSIPFYFANRIIPVVIGVWIALRFAQNLNQKNLEQDRESNLKKSVERILDSENFLTALRSALPQGEEDKEYGLDYIPYMLNENQLRLKELKKTTRFYFILTLCVGLIITTVVVYFGYLIVNEEAAGTPRTLSQINTRLGEIKPDIELVFESELGDFSESNYLRRNYLNNLLNFSGVNLDPKYDEEINEIVKDVKDDIDEAYKTNDWKKLGENLANHIFKIQNLEPLTSGILDLDLPKNKDFSSYLQNLKEAKNKTQEFASSKENALRNLNTAANSLNNLIEKANEELGSEEARTTELIKRLGLSLIVASFLLAVLRYTSSIYRDHYQDMRKVQHEGQTIRRFYIALKSSFKTEEGTTPNQIIANFVNRPEVLSKKGNLPSNDEFSNNINVDLIKELLSVLSKKI